jgi:NAD(P)H dehydrogenase (quinone)
MRKPKFLVIGASGKTGAAVVADLRARDMPVRAVVRRIDYRSEALSKLGAEIAVADIRKPDQVRQIMRGVNRAYWMAPFDPLALEAAEGFAEAALQEKIESIVGLSQWLASPNHPSLLTRHSFAIDKLFGSLPGLTYTCINPGFFADNYLRLIGFAAQLGVLPSLTGNSRNAPPSNEDIARTSVAALLDPAKHNGKSYRPTGPALLSTSDMAAILSKVLGRRVMRMEMPFWLFLKAARMQGVNPYEMSGLRYYIHDHKQGAFEQNAPNHVVEELTGRPPESFETIARRYAQRSDAKRSFGSELTAWANFMRTPFMPGFNLDRVEKELGIQKPEYPRFAMKDPEWRVSHQALVAQGIGI